MKKLFSFIVTALLSVSMFAATQYCQEPLEAADGTALLSLKHVSGNSYEVELIAQEGMIFDGSWMNVNLGVNQTQGAGITFKNENWIFASDGSTATYDFETASETSVPTDFYGKYICFKKTGGTTGRDLVEFNLAAITDIDWTAKCTTGPEDTEAPVMVSASVASASYTSITLNVAATDNVGVRRYHVVTTGVDKDFTPSNDQIVVTGLSAGTSYNIIVSAKDAAGNVSANSVTVEGAKTLSYPAAPAAPTRLQADVRSIYSDTYTSALAHDFSKNSWSGIQYSEIALDETNHYLLYTTANANWIAWGSNVEGADAIIAADGFNDGTNQGLDLSEMEYLHVDIFADADFVSGVMTFNDDRLAELGTLKGGEWNSIDLPLNVLETSKRNNLRWMKFEGFNGVSMVIIDNVYAWKSSNPTALENVNGAQNTVKYIENGQLVIIRDGIRYNAMGQVTE